ncbi:putative RNA methyltransferase [Lactovum odontotermitis]
MLKKIEKARLFLSKHAAALRCPICRENLTLIGNSLVCVSRHTFNLNKKGYVNFLQTAPDTRHYTRKMFEPRRRLIQSGMYDGLLAEIQPYLSGDSLLDVGTGEGSFLQLLQFGTGAKFAFDIAKDGIEMATELDMDSFLSLSDLTNLPFADNSMSTVLNILTPSNYAEFKRVLAADGRLIKVVPDKLYLQELRQVYGLPADHDNSAVIARFAQEFPDFQQHEIYYEFDIPENLRTDFLAMSPLEWAVSEDVKANATQNPPKKATVHLQLLIS